MLSALYIIKGSDIHVVYYWENSSKPFFTQRFFKPENHSGIFCTPIEVNCRQIEWIDR